MDAEGISRRRASWQKHFREGLRYAAVVDAQRLHKALRGNAAVVVGLIVLAVVAAAGLVALAVTGIGRLPTYLLVGLLLLLLLVALRTGLRTRAQLKAGLVSPNCFTVSTDGIRLADAVDVPWADVTGLVVVDTTGARASGVGAFFGRMMGSPEELLLIGVRNGVLKRLSEAAGPRLRPLFWSNWGAEAGGAIRIPLDRLLSDDMRGRQIAGLDGIAPAIPVRFGVTNGRDSSKHLAKDVLSGTPLPVDEVAAAEAKADADAAVAASPGAESRSTASSPASAPPAPDPASAPLTSSSIPPSPAPAAAAAARRPAESSASVPPSPPSSSTPPPPPRTPETPASAADSRMTVRELAGIVLSADGRRRFDEATSALTELGPEGFAERHPDLDDGFSDDGPAPLTILLGVAGLPHPPTVGWCDAGGQDEESQVLSLLRDSCRNRGLAEPLWPDALDGERDVVALFRGADRALAEVGLRLLFIDDDSDTYHFTPVETSALVALDGRAGEGFTLRSIDWFGPAPVVTRTASVAGEGNPPPQHADTALYSRPFGPVDAVTVRHEGKGIGYLYSGIGNEAHRGGVHFHATVTNPVKAPLAALIKDLQARGIPAAEGFATLYGRVLGNGVSVDAEPERHPAFIAFDRVARAFAYSRRVPGFSDEQWQRGSAGYGTFVRGSIDAALRGEIRVSQDVAGLIADLDAVLLAQPSAEERTLVFEIDRELLPDAAGMHVFLPSYVPAHEEGVPARPAPGQVGVRLQVPAGTGTLDVPAAFAREIPLVLLPRGATITISALSDVVEARLEGCAATPVRAGDWLGPERTLPDTRADEEYFAEALVHRTARNHSSDLDIHEPNPGAAEIDVTIRGRRALHAFWAGFSTFYSQGLSADQIRREYDRLLTRTERVLELLREHPSDQTSALFREDRDFYRYWLLLVSLALAFRVDEETFDRVVAASHFGHGDRLIDRLIATRRPAHRIGDELRFPRIVGRLDRAFAASDPTRPLEEHLDRWYALWKGIDGWDGHLLMNRRGYFGYWAFEVLGVVAALDLDDEPLRDLEYYPRDLGGRR